MNYVALSWFPFELRHIYNRCFSWSYTCSRGEDVTGLPSRPYPFYVEKIPKEKVMEQNKIRGKTEKSVIGHLFQEREREREREREGEAKEGLGVWYMYPLWSQKNVMRASQNRRIGKVVLGIFCLILIWTH